MTRRYMIIGAGAAGLAACEAIRRIDPHGEILLVSEEAEGYYSRPGLAYYLTGEMPIKGLFPFTDADFEHLKISRLHDHAVRIHPQSYQVEFQSGSILDYHALLIATGSKAAGLKVPNFEAQGVVKLDAIADAVQILNLARKARSAVIVGGGITAIEIVEGLVARGVKTHYFLRGERYWSNVLDETESRLVEHLLKEDGVKIHYHTELAEIISRHGRVSGVRTMDGGEIKCELLAVAIGVLPRVELARASGLRVDNGIWVDEYLETSQPGIFAAGDAAEAYDPFTGKTQLNTLWPLARDQGRIAGHNMAAGGGSTPPRLPYRKSVPFNVTRLAGLTTTIIGTVGAGRDADLIGIARGDSETWRQLPDAIAAQSNFDVNRLRVMVRQNGEVCTMIGALVMGDQTLSRPLQQLIGQKTDITSVRDRLLAPAAAIGDTIVDFWLEYKKTGAVAA